MHDNNFVLRSDQKFAQKNLLRGDCLDIGDLAIKPGALCRSRKAQLEVLRGLCADIDCKTEVCHLPRLSLMQVRYTKTMYYDWKGCWLQEFANLGNSMF